MGCECQKPEEKNNELKAEEKNLAKIFEENPYTDTYLPNNNNNALRKNLVSQDNKPNDEFRKYIFQKINSLRQNPQSYIDSIIKAKNNVTTDKSGIKIYKSSVKVAINTGESA